MTTNTGAILVTGPTGTVGEPLTRILVAAGLPVVAGARHPASFTGPTECRLLDFEQPETFTAALAGISRVFLMRPPAISDTKRYLRPFITAAQRSGVQQVVFLSVMGVNRVMPHWQVEKDLQASKMAWTFLRPSFFAQNLQTAYRVDIAQRDQIRLACGRGRTSFIDTRDVAAIAALTLSDPSPRPGDIHTLTGSAALDYHQVASMLSAELGRTIIYVPLSMLTYRRELRRRSLPRDYVTVQLLISLVARLGFAAKVTDTVERLLQRPATSLSTYLHDQRNNWATTGR